MAIESGFPASNPSTYMYRRSFVKVVLVGVGVAAFMAVIRSLGP